MEVLFLQNVSGVARKGEIKNVKEGYFKNFLAPKKVAVLASGAVKKQAEKMRQSEVIQKERLVEEAKDVVKKIDGQVIVINAKANGEKLYGSITEKEVADALEESTKVRLGKSNILLPDNIKTVGVHEIPVKIVDGAEATIKLEVKGDEK